MQWQALFLTMRSWKLRCTDSISNIVSPSKSAKSHKQCMMVIMNEQKNTMLAEWFLKFSACKRLSRIFEIKDSQNNLFDFLEILDLISETTSKTTPWISHDPISLDVSRLRPTYSEITERVTGPPRILKHRRKTKNIVDKIAHDQSWVVVLGAILAKCVLKIENKLLFKGLYLPQEESILNQLASSLVSPHWFQCNSGTSLSKLHPLFMVCLR